MSTKSIKSNDGGRCPTHPDRGIDSGCCPRPEIFPFYGEDAHPEGYEGPCACNLCLSYADLW